MGSLLLIPGIFYGIKLIQIAFSNDNDMRDEILSEFPLEPDEAYYWYYNINNIWYKSYIYVTFYVYNIFFNIIV